MDAITKAYDGKVQMIDTSIVRVHQQGATAKRGIAVTVSVVPEAGSQPSMPRSADPAEAHRRFEGWNAEHPLRAVRLGNIRPSDRRRVVAAGLDAIEKIHKIGLQVCLVVRRRDAVGAGSAVVVPAMQLRLYGR